MTKPGPKPTADRDTVATTIKSIRWSVEDLKRVDALMLEDESFGGCVKRIVNEAFAARVTRLVTWAEGADDD